MLVRTLFATVALGCVCMLGCSGEPKQDGDKKDAHAKDKVGHDADHDANHGANHDANHDHGATKTPQPTDTAAPVKYEPYDAAKWAPDPGKAKPNAWRPEDSELSKTGESVFNALKKAVKGSE
jgi:hypothetical protein